MDSLTFDIKGVFKELRYTAGKEMQKEVLNRNLVNAIEYGTKIDRLYMLGLIYHSEGRLKEAQKIIQKVEIEATKADNCKFFLPYIELAYGLIFLAEALRPDGDNDFQQAINKFQSCTKINENLAYAWYMLGSSLHVYANRQRSLPPKSLNKLYLDAVSNYDKAIEVLVSLGELFKEHPIDRNGRKVAIFPSLYNDKGNALMRIPEYLTEERQKQILECYEIVTKQAPDFAYPLNGMGTLHRKAGRYSQAINCYKQSIEKDPNFSHPLNYLGDCYLELNRFEDAIEAYQKARNKEPSNVFPINGLGRVCYELGKRFNPDKFFILADDFFCEALDKDPAFLYGYIYRGRLLTRMGEYDAALNAFNDAKKIAVGNKYRLSEIEEYILEINKIKEILSKTDDDEALQVIEKTIKRGIDMNIFSNAKRFQDFLCEKIGNLDSEEEFSFEVLRRWNSFTPLITDGKGGGYFVKVFGKGIVLDPGFNFIENFKGSGHKFHEIDAVVVSHSHDDHTADFESIINLLYRYNKFLEEEYITGRIARFYGFAKSKIQKWSETSIPRLKKQIDNNRQPPIALDIKKYFDKQFREKRRQLKIMVPCSVEEKFRYTLQRDMKQISELIILCPENKKERIKYLTEMTPQYQSEPVIIDFTHKENVQNVNKSGMSLMRMVEANGFNKNNTLVIPTDCAKSRTKRITISPINAKHEPEKVPLGYVFNPDKHDVVLVYSGDTGWGRYNKKSNGTIPHQYEDIRKKWENETIVLVAHLGGFKDYELNYLENRDKAFYRSHLGRLGLVMLCQTLKPKLCILSEFGEEFKGVRVKLVRIMQEVFPGICFIPADIGLKLDFSSKDIKIRAIRNIDKRFKWIEYDYITLDKLDFVEVPSLDSIAYFAISPDLSPDDVVEALMANYHPSYWDTQDPFEAEVQHWLYLELLNERYKNRSPFEAQEEFYQRIKKGV